MLFAKLNELKSKYLSKRLIYATDVFLSVLASVVVLLTVNLLDTSRSFAGRHILLYSILSAGISAVTLLLTRCYRIIIRHLGIKDLVRFATAAIGKVLLVAVAMFAFGRFSYAIGIVLVLDFFLTFFLLIGVRILMIVAYDIVTQRILEKNESKRVLVYGLSDKSVASIVRLHSSPHYKVLGFLMPGRTGKGGMIDQLPIINFENEDDINAILSDYGVNAILFAKETDAQAEEDRLIKVCSHRGIKCLIMPSVDEVVEGQTIIRPREIKVEDLLGRNEIKISMEKIIENFKDKVVMVTGAAGSIGSELCRQLAGFGIKRLILFDNAETPMHNLRLELEDNYPQLDFVPVIGDVRQIPRLDFAFRTYKPQVVFHAAAYKHVPLMEENPCEAVLVNVIGSRQVADKCIEYGVEKMVMISTDKAVNPTNIMGCTKRLAEIYVQSLGLALQNGTVKGKTTFVTTRFGNVLGSNGSVIPRFREQIAAGGPVTVTHPDINRFFMTIPEACRLVMEAATMATGNEIFVFDMGKPVKIDTLARRMIHLAGFVPDEDIKIEYTGLRPGEKLYEEVLSNEENTKPSFHERIRIAEVREYDYDEAKDVVNRLETLSRDVDIPDMVRLMKRTVPEYKSDHSRFEIYDKELEAERTE